MPRTGYISVGIRGDAQYARRLKIIAARRGQSMAELVRVTLDKELAADLQEVVSFEKSGTLKQRTVHKGNK